jgi:hypothetical protein
MGVCVRDLFGGLPESGRSNGHGASSGRAFSRDLDANVVCRENTDGDPGRTTLADVGRYPTTAFQGLCSSHFA